MSIYKIRVRRDTSGRWTFVNPVLGIGEVGFETDTRKLKVGDGTTPWNSLSYVAYEVSAHNQAISTITGLQAALDNKAALSHSHAISDVVNLQTALNGKAALSHSHAFIDVTGLQAALDNKSDVGHGHTISDITALQGALDFKAAYDHTHTHEEVTATGFGREVIFNTSGLFDASPEFQYDRTTSHLIVAGTIESSGVMIAREFYGDLLGSVHAPCKNTYGSTIGKGVPVYLTGTVGASNTIQVSLARADTAASMPAIGVLNQSLANNATGHVTIVGSLKNIDTSNFSVGDVLFVGPTGGLTNVRPTSTGHLVQNIGRVGRSAIYSGELFILGAGRTNDVPNNLGLDSLYDVVISSPASGQVVFYDGSSWINSSIGAIPTGYVISVNSATGVITNVAKTNEANIFSLSQSMPTGVFGSDLRISDGLIQTKTIPLNIDSDLGIYIGDTSLSGNSTRFFVEDSSEIINMDSASVYFERGAFSLGPSSSNVISIAKPTVISNNSTYVLPSGVGSNNNVLSIQSATGSINYLQWSNNGSKTYSILTPLDNQPPASNYATIDTRNSIMVLDFDAATDESAVFVVVMPEAVSLGSGLKVRLHWMADTATTGTCRWGVQIERMNTDEDSDSFDTAATAGSTTNGTSGIITTTEITITTIDSVAAGEPYRLKVFRDADGTSGTDDMTGDAQLVAVEVRSAS